MLPSASRLDRVAVCPASAVLPQADYVSEAGKRGTAIHAYLASVGTIGKEKALEATPPEHREACAVLDLELLSAVDPEKFAHEVTFAWSYKTCRARELGRNLNRSYAQATKDEIVGTADVVGLGDGVVVIWDWKSGRAPAAATSWQLRFLALAAARTYGVSSAEVAMAQTNGWIDPARFDAFDLDVIERELDNLVDRVLVEREAVARGEEPHMVLGSHCDYCSAIARCPAQTQLALAIGGNPEEAIGAKLELTPENAPQVYERLSAAKRLIAFVEERLQAYATANPIALPGGRVYGPVEIKRETLDGDAAFSVLESLHGAGVARAACELKATKEGIKRALRPIAEEQGKTFSSLESEAFDELRRVGGVYASKTTQVREHKP